MSTSLCKNEVFDFFLKVATSPEPLLKLRPGFTNHWTLTLHVHDSEKKPPYEWQLVCKIMQLCSTSQLDDCKKNGRHIVQV